ncbi:uncharacterized protein [Nicotiana tomentosiformis]|uniref:uncharacterized protein n=1 Tax=Nicotiana tomentosiformis TaxID=4098 RepID=UPI00388CDE0F
MVVHKALPRTEDISERDSENAPDDSFGAVAIEGSPTFPAFSARAIREAQALGALELDRPHDGEDPFRDLFIGVEDTTGTSDASDLFHGVQQALNQDATVHRESCSWSRTELRRYEAELQRVIEERNSLKLLLGQRGEEIKDLQVELAKAHQDQIDLSEQKIEMIGKLCEEVDVIRAESLKWKGFAAEKETARTQLSSAENQVQKMKEKSSVQTRRIEELEARLASVLAKSESDAEKAKADADALVAIYRADAEAAQVQEREAAETIGSLNLLSVNIGGRPSRRSMLEVSTSLKRLKGPKNSKPMLKPWFSMTMMMTMMMTMGVRVDPITGGDR